MKRPNSCDKDRQTDVSSNSKRRKEEGTSGGGSADGSGVVLGRAEVASERMKPPPAPTIVDHAASGAGVNTGGDRERENHASQIGRTLAPATQAVGVAQRASGKDEPIYYTVSPTVEFSEGERVYYKSPTCGQWVPTRALMSFPLGFPLDHALSVGVGLPCRATGADLWSVRTLLSHKLKEELLRQIQRTTSASARGDPGSPSGAFQGVYFRANSRATITVYLGGSGESIMLTFPVPTEDSSPEAELNVSDLLEYLLRENDPAWWGESGKPPGQILTLVQEESTSGEEGAVAAPGAGGASSSVGPWRRSMAGVASGGIVVGGDPIRGDEEGEEQSASKSVELRDDARVVDGGVYRTVVKRIFFEKGTRLKDLELMDDGRAAVWVFQREWEDHPLFKKTASAVDGWSWDDFVENIPFDKDDCGILELSDMNALFRLIDIMGADSCGPYTDQPWICTWARFWNRRDTNGTFAHLRFHIYFSKCGFRSRRILCHFCMAGREVGKVVMTKSSERTGRSNELVCGRRV